MEVAAKGKRKRRHLNATECAELAQSSKGADALTRPHVAAPGRDGQDFSRRLHPKATAKRPGTSSAGPSKQHKAINNYFAVKGVISSSPTKSPRSCSAARPSTAGSDASSFPGEDEDDDDDDDVSLLASAGQAGHIDDASMLAAVEEEDEEEEDEDVSLLAACSAAKLPTVVDHLEGMTPEMFGADDMFDSEDDDDVEALPDAHYGLLGRQKELLQPQGCMEDLPREILMQILCELPVRDLYCNASLVCQRWRDIVQDPKFVPFQKQYYRYMMSEKTTLAEINRVLTDCRVLDLSNTSHNLRNLVTLMAQYVPGERVFPEKVLECVRKHRLFPHAEASIRLHIPRIQKDFSLGLQGPNPYAAMALILLLSGNVADVQALVSRLAGCMSTTAIKEYLSRVATLLLAAMRVKQISNRMHYNIHYVLHLMQNEAVCGNPGQNGQPQVKLTHEQLQILNHDSQPEDVIKIVAFAGTGKTTTLVKYAEQRPHLSFLYVAFNKSVAGEAQRRFPPNVTSKTVHSLAFADVGKIYHNKKKLTFAMKPYSINKVLPEGRGGFAKAKTVTTTLTAFMASADPEIAEAHVPRFRVLRKKLEPEHFNPNGSHVFVDIKEYINPKEIPLFVRDAKAIWNKMKDPNEKTEDAYYITHDGYLKLWQLQQPQLSERYDVIMIDEAQDCSPVIMDVMLSQRCTKILVGDPHQQIYTFRGAVNALEQVEHTHIYYLTQSFRFGAEIAYVGATILSVCKGVHKILLGGEQKGGVCDQEADQVRDAKERGVSLSPGETAILARSNATVFSEAVALTSKNPATRIHFVGGVDGIGLDRILEIWKLSLEENAKDKNFKDPLLRAFSKRAQPFITLMYYAEQTQDSELISKLEIVRKYKCCIPQLVGRLKECAVANRSKADFIIGTVHKAKGLEFNTVMVCDDFIKIPPPGEELCFYYKPHFHEIPKDELNLLYVAVTRAKSTLIITKNVCRVLALAGEYLLKPDLPASCTPAAVAGQPVACTTRQCPNSVAPKSAFVMCKRSLKCSDDVTEGGPLCDRCAWACVGPLAFLAAADPLALPPVPLPRGLRSWPLYHHIFPDMFQYLHGRS